MLVHQYTLFLSRLLLLLIPAAGGLVAATADSFIYPLAVPWTTTQSFDAWNGDWFGFHIGEDVVVSSELPVMAAGNGTVVHVGQHTGYGWLVIVEHALPSGDALAPTVLTVYAHMRKAGIIAVGVSVSKGQTIGYLSSNQYENGGYPFTHIHFAIRQPQTTVGCSGASQASYGSQDDPTSNWWTYAGYSSLFTQCNNKRGEIMAGPSAANWSTYLPLHQQVVGRWQPPSIFINARLTQPPRASNVSVRASTDTTIPPGGAWAGPAQYRVTCGSQPPGNESVIPLLLMPVSTPLPVNCTVSFTSGGPANSSITAITYTYGSGTINCGLLVRGPSCTAPLGPGQALMFIIQFTSNPPTAGFTMMSSGSQSKTDGQTLNLSVPSGTMANVNFDATTRSTAVNGANITGWQWSINNSPIAANGTFSHSFPPGTSTVSLDVTDSRGFQSTTATGTINVNVAGSTYTGSLNQARRYHGATLLNDSSVLITGGDAGGGGLAPITAELYDPNTGTFRFTHTEMNFSHSQHTATRLNNGQVLIAGGVNPDGSASANSEIFDQPTETFQAVGPLNFPRASHSSVLLPNGHVFVIGGYYPTAGSSPFAELYDPVNKLWTIVTAPYPGAAQTSQRLALLSNGDVLVTGGYNSITSQWSQEVWRYIPTSNSWKAMVPMVSAPAEHKDVVLPNGKVLIITSATNSVVSYTPGATEVYDADSGVNGSTLSAGTVDVGAGFAAASLNDGEVLVTGGIFSAFVGYTCFCAAQAVSTADLFDPTTSTWTAVAPMKNARSGHTATLLATGAILTTGGYSFETGYGFYQLTLVSSSELWAK